MSKYEIVRHIEDLCSTLVNFNGDGGALLPLARQLDLIGHAVLNEFSDPTDADEIIDALGRARDALEENGSNHYSSKPNEDLITTAINALGDAEYKLRSI